MRPPRGNVSLWFRLVVVAAGAFVITIMAFIASTLFGEAETPVTRFLNHQGGRLMAAEATITLLLGLFAIVADRRQILRDQNKNENLPGSAATADSKQDDVSGEE